MSIQIYHNPRCSKSRQTLELLQDKGINPEVVLYLTTPPSADDIKNILSMLDASPRDIMRRKEAEYKEQNLDDAELSDDELITAITKTPKLLERPIVINDSKAAIGRPPENVLGIL